MDLKLMNIWRESYHHTFRVVPYDYCEGTWLAKDYLEIKEAIDNFEVRDDDIWLCGLPKTGTTWTKEMIWCIANDLDFKKAEQTLLSRFPHLETSHSVPLCCLARRRGGLSDKLSVQHVAQLPSPRFIKTHLPYHMIPKQLREGKTKAKMIYVSRNPKDTCISYYYFDQYAGGYCGTFENFCELFMNGRIAFIPFWENVIGYWTNKDSRDILFLKYEDMKNDLHSVIRKTASFLNKQLNDDQVCRLGEHLSFKNMKSNPAVNFEKNFEGLKSYGPSGECKNVEKFIRKGESNQWKTEMTDHLIERFDDWTNKKLEKYPELKREFC